MERTDDPDIRKSLRSSEVSEDHLPDHRNNYRSRRSFCVRSDHFHIQSVYQGICQINLTGIRSTCRGALHLVRRPNLLHSVKWECLPAFKTISSRWKDHRL